MSYDFDQLLSGHGRETYGNFSIKFLYFHYTCYHKFGNCEKNDAEPYRAEWDWGTYPKGGFLAFRRLRVTPM